MNGYTSRPTTSAVWPTARRPVTVMPSRLVGRPLAQQAVRAEHEHEDEDREHDRVGPARGDVLVAPRREESDDEAAEGSTPHAADAAEHGGREGAQPGLVAHPP